MKKLVIFLVLPIVTFAAEESVFENLMDEPASMFDIGMMRMWRFMEKHDRERTALQYYQRKAESGARDGRLYIDYNSELDEIHVDFSVHDGASNQLQMRQGCQMVLDPLGPLNIAIAKFSNVWFSPIGKDRSEKFSAGFAKSVLKKMVLYCSVYDDQTDGVRFRARLRHDNGGQIEVLKSEEN